MARIAAVLAILCAGIIDSIATEFNLIIGAFAQGCQKHPVCDQDQLARCQKTFNQDVGIPRTCLILKYKINNDHLSLRSIPDIINVYTSANLDVKKYDQLQDAVESLIGTQGIDELGRVCHSIKNMCNT